MPKTAVALPLAPRHLCRRAAWTLGLLAAAAQPAGAACVQRGAVGQLGATPEARPDRPEDLPRCGCKIPCAAHVEKAPCACRRGEHGPHLDDAGPPPGDAGPQPDRQLPKGGATSPPAG